MKYRNPNESIEFNDNSISAYLVQQGNCYVMGNRLNVHQMKCIRKIPVDIALILGNLITVIFDYQILRKPLKILSL